MSIFERFTFAGLIMLGLWTTLRYALWWFQPGHIPTNRLSDQYSFFPVVDFLLFLILSFVVFFGLILKIGTWFTTWFMKRPVYIPPQTGLRVAFLTCYVPGNEPLEMLRKTLIAMKKADYTHDTWVLDEGNRDEVKSLCAELGVKHFSRFDKSHYNQQSGPFRKKTKAGNLNSWRNEYEHEYDIVAQLDMDHVPHSDYLMKLLGYFTDPGVGFVGIPQIYKNSENWIARGAAEQTHFYYGPLQQGFYGAHMPFLIGTTHVYRVKAMQSFGGYSPTIAEDYLTGMHFFSHGWRGVYVPEVLAEGLGPVTWEDYFNQQLRWSYGLFEILFKHTHRHIFKLSLNQRINLFFSQLFYFSGIATFLGFILTSVYLVFGINSANIDVIEWGFYAIPAYFSGVLILIFLHRFYIDPKNEPKFGIYGMLLGQAANIIYTVAFAKFITKQKLTYVVTSKNNDSVSSVNWKVFTSHIMILLISILTLEISFITSHDSIVMRFWAVVNAFFLTGIILTGYWFSIKSLFKGLLDHYRLFEFEVNNSSQLPHSPTLTEKYAYLNGNNYLFLGFSVVSFITVTICMFNFIIGNPLMWPLMVYLSFSFVYFCVSTSVNFFFKRFDINVHKELINKWKKHLNKSIDIFLPTAGEPLYVLRNTWDGVRELVENYSGKITVYCLDDADSGQVKKMAQEFGFEYSVRPNRGWFKKAGNLRFGFENSNSEFIVIFDADFRPRNDFLSELLPYFFENEKIGLVQSPQYFDVHGKQNWLERGAGAVQELFYRYSQVSRQNSDASICVGSNAIYRRAALNQIGGTALIEHSEDVHTGFNLRTKGWTIQYVPIILAKGLCPSEMKAFFKQQYRWCLGSMSLLGSHKFWTIKLSLMASLSYFSGFLYYIHTGLSSFFVPVIPLAVLFLYPDQVTIGNYLLLAPSLIFIHLIYPMWHKSTYGIEAWAVRSIYGWAHLFAIVDSLTNKKMHWQPSGSKMGSDTRYNIFRALQVIFNFLPAVLWVTEASKHVLLGRFMFLPLLIGGIYYLLIASKVTFYSTEQVPFLLTRGLDHALRIRTIPAITVLFLSLLIGGITNYAFQNNLFQNGTSREAHANEIDNINSQLSLVRADTKTAEASDEAAISLPIIYYQQVNSGDSATTIYRKIIASYEIKNGLKFSPKVKLDLENNLVLNRPLQRLRKGEIISVPETDLVAAVKFQTQS